MANWLQLPNFTRAAKYQVLLLNTFTSTSTDTDTWKHSAMCNIILIVIGTCVTYFTDSDITKKCWYWPDTDTDIRIGAALLFAIKVFNRYKECKSLLE